MVKTAFSGQSDRRKRRIDLSHESEICDHNLLLVRSLSFLTGLNFYGAIFGVAMNEALGSVVSVGMVVSAKALATVISEIPSGILAGIASL
ncbi:hypothetical protein SARC_15458 [Sphaeroforma arctica JP610]|uniref:Uncharacterized protein n=1 Tax=Sphaeroforma arctica JP610 TaxID=667725 RepID=A0A0L0F766_9EUKA|nr:hypothetical protein SARC_15458 [Sphaeroforma arctica JP610]KNC71993.1 hypothetical protein SARC_15458 [Sphaeroforma arctica JP610]|eukprot:XP_014145895.1 hypothetical protein SARC_15458 [Sphaeroforma arctica JP610]